MARVPSKRRTCDVSWCDSCRWPRRSGKGPHLRSEAVPATGPAEVVVFRALNPDGSREAWMRTYSDHCWSDRTPLPRRPRKAFAAAVTNARQFVRSGVLT